MVVNILSNVPNNNLEALNFKEFADESSFDTEKFKKIYYMKPIGNIFKVSNLYIFKDLLKNTELVLIYNLFIEYT